MALSDQEQEHALTSFLERKPPNTKRLRCLFEKKVELVGVDLYPLFGGGKVSNSKRWGGGFEM